MKKRISVFVFCIGILVGVLRDYNWDVTLGVSSYCLSLFWLIYHRGWLNAKIPITVTKYEPKEVQMALEKYEDLNQKIIQINNILFNVHNWRLQKEPRDWRLQREPGGYSDFADYKLEIELHGKSF